MSAPPHAIDLRPPRLGRARGVRRRVMAWTFSTVATAMAVGSGIALGLVLTAAALRNGEEVGAIRIGSWRLPVGEGTVNINPYQRAALARRGAIPLSAGQGVAFTAVQDDSGQKLDRRCAYTISGPVPRARFWTVAVADRDGFAIPNEADRFAFTSDDVLRDEDGSFNIVLSHDVAPGNWLPLRGAGRFAVVLRLYDSAVPGLGSRELNALALPHIQRGACS